ncbi:MAG: hypothetical protein FJ100_05810 [Deltaproteobacteria bacterium]|nr:hypothetical protein [Deltaproteobacteria bacterium]
MTDLRAWMARPRRFAVLIAIVVALPALGAGTLIDDWGHAATVQGKVPGAPAWWNLYDFGDGNPVRMRQAQDIGYPWYAHPELRVRFLRPLSSALTYLDHTAFADCPWVAHAISIALYALVVAGVATLLLRTLGPGLGGLAAVLYAVDDAHTIPAAWLANRNALVAAAPAIWGTVAWLRWRQDGWGAGRVWAVAGFALGLAGGETALSALALPVCFELSGAGSPGSRPLQRLRALWPLLAMAVVYALSYKALGYGASHSGAYLDPVRETGPYLAAAGLRIPGLLGVMAFNAPIEITVAMPGSMWWFAAVGLAGVATVALLVRRAWAALDAEAQRHLPWLVLGSLLALVPVAATFPAGRLLTVASIGGAAAVAVAIGSPLPVLARAAGLAVQRASIAVRGTAWILVALHVVLAPLAFFGGTLVLGWASRAVAGPAYREGLDAAAGKTAIFPAVPDVMGIYGLLWRVAYKQPAPSRWRALGLALHDIELRVIDAHTVELRTVQGVLLETEAEQIMRGPRDLFEPGDRVEINDMTVTVLQTDGQGHPTRLAFRFDRPIDDPDHVWLQWKDGRLRRMELPRDGLWVLLKREPGVFGF